MSNCLPPEQVQPIDPDGGLPPTQGGTGSPDDGPIEDTVTDTNVNYASDAEDPYQDGTSTEPLQHWEIGDEPVVKNFTFFPRETEVTPQGVKQFRTGYGVKRSKSKYHPYETSGTATYNKYGDAPLPANLSQYKDEIITSFDGVEFKYSMSQLLACPTVDGYLMSIMQGIWGREDGTKPYGNQPYNRDLIFLLFWSKTTFQIEHMIRVKAPYKEHVIERHPDFPGRSRNQGAFPYTGTNLTKYASQFFDVNRYSSSLISGRDITTYFTGERPELNIEERAEARSLIRLQGADEIDQLDWNRARKRVYNPVNRTLSGFATVWTYKENEFGENPGSQAYGCRQRVPAWSTIDYPMYGMAPFTAKLPSPVTSVTQLDMDVMIWDTLEYTKHLYNNQNAPAEGMSLAARADRDDPAGSNKRISDLNGTATGVSPLGQGHSFHLDRAPELSDSGLRMAIMGRVAFMSYYRNYSNPQCIHLFERASLNSEWVYKGASVDKIYFDPVSFPEDWENLEGNHIPIYQQRRVWMEAFFEGETLHCISHNFYGHTRESMLEFGTFRRWTPDFVNSSFKRGEGPVYLSEDVIVVPNLKSTYARQQTNWSTSNVVFEVAIDNGTASTADKRMLKLDFTTGTYTFLDQDPWTDPRFPARLDHLRDMEFWEGQWFGPRRARQPWYGQWYWEDRIGEYREYVEYNGFKIFGVRETPYVPNLAYGQYMTWWQGNSTITHHVVGPLYNREHRRGMLGVGEVVAIDANGTEVWRAEPYDSQAWAAHDPELKTHGRRMLFGRYPSQRDLRPDQHFLSADSGTVDEEYDALWGATYDETNRRTGYEGVPMVGTGRVNFGTRLKLIDGNRLFISHDSLPLGIDVPPVLKGSVLDDRNVYTYTGPRRRTDEYYSTPRDATKLHHSGYVELDLTTIPELNP